MKLNLSKNKLFNEDEITFDKKVTFIYGKNGTGKTTISNLCNTLNDQFDVHVFQGFESVISENLKLNAIALGENNSIISSKIEKIKYDIELKNHEIEEIKKLIEEPIDKNTTNIWTRLNDADKDYNNEKDKIIKFYKNSASNIKNLTNPSVASTTYNRNDFEKDIPKAKYLTEDEISIAKNTINTPIKEVKDISFPSCNFNELLKDVNTLIQKNIKETKPIERIDNEEKRAFALRGLQLHNKGDICVFCGNKIKDEEYDKLNNLFSIEEITNYQRLLNNKKKELDNLSSEIIKVKINPENFYPEYVQEAKKLKDDTDALVYKIQVFLRNLSDSVDEKCKNIFGSQDEISIEVPENFTFIQNEFSCLKDKNNRIELINSQNNAKSDLRLHYVKKYMDEFHYEMHSGILEKLTEQKNKIETEMEEQKDKIEKDLFVSLNSLNSILHELEQQTISEEKLVDILNSKLSNMVSFELHHDKDESNKGIYNIQDRDTQEIRDITKLSAGEKNIIAFLYFIEKINEIDPNKVNNLPKLIVFDDPMSSNDDGMQYLIMTNLHILMNKLGENDKLIILTHNKHFYLNIKYGLSYKKYSFYHFQSAEGKTYINKITREEEDFSTSYESLWEELKFLYNCKEAKADLLLNPMRRIIETYCNFNSIEQNDFYANLLEAKKLFNVNSHSIDDLEAELNGKEKNEILILFENCFKNNNAEKHYNSHWENYCV